MRIRLQFLILLFPLAISVALGAQAPEHRSIPVFVWDAKGNPVGNLKAENFRARFRGREAKVLSAIPTRAGKTAILIDTSGSMRPADKKKMIPAVGIARLVVFAIGDDHPISLLTVADKIQKLCEPRRGAKELDALLLKAAEAGGRGRTALWDGILESARGLEPVSVGDSVMVISDGRDNKSAVRPAHLREELLRIGVRLFLISIDEIRSVEVRPKEDQLIRPEEMRWLVEGTGGIEIDLRRESDAPEKLIARLLARLAALKAVYKMEIELPDLGQKSGDLKIEVVDERGERIKKLKMAYPREFVPTDKAAPKP